MITKSVKVQWLPGYKRWIVSVIESTLTNLAIVTFYRDEASSEWITVDGRAVAEDVAAFCDQAVNLFGDIPEGVL